MKKSLVLSAALAAFVLILSSNSSSALSKKPAEEPKKSPVSAPQEGQPILSGTVVESFDSGGYTYINIENEGRSSWIAAPRADVTVGQNATFQPGMVMNNFTSKTLNRTFDAIVFSAGIVEAQGGEKPFSHPETKATSTAPEATNIEKADDPDAYTVAELYQKSTELDTKIIAVRGQIVKFSPNIMKMNWAHIQDGSGNPAAGTNDMLVTSQEALSVGDIVTLKGTLSKDKDFGSGYKYSVIIEDASIQK